MPYYEWLKANRVVYKKVKISEYLKNLDAAWCKIDTNTRKQTEATYCDKWKQQKHTTVFGKKLNDEQADLDDTKIVITNKDTIQFYIENMYDSATFDKEDITKREKNMDSDSTWKCKLILWRYLRQHQNIPFKHRRHRQASTTGKRRQCQGGVARSSISSDMLWHFDLSSNTGQRICPSGV